MYVLDGVVYAGEPSPVIRVCGVRPLDDHRLWLRFSTGEVKIFDFVPLLSKPVFAPLADEKVFAGVYIDYGVPTWLDGMIDIAPETLYYESAPVESISNAAV